MARGWCGSHYKRWYKYGNPIAGCAYDKFAHNRKLPAKERILARTRRVGACLEYTGDINSNGYGRVVVAGKRSLAHRWSYETFVGCIPLGLQVNHSCDNRLCIEPKHLWAGTQSENLLDASRKGRL